MAIRYSPGEGLQSYSPEKARETYIKKTFKKTTSGGGGGGGSSSSDAARMAAEAKMAAAAKAAAEEAARQAAFEEANRKAQEAAAERERIRIANLKTKLLALGAQRKVQMLRDAKTRERIRMETIINNKTKERVLVRTNLDTGRVTTRTFQRRPGSRRTYESGGLTKAGEPQAIESIRIDIPKNQNVKVDLSLIDKASLSNKNINQGTIQNLQARFNTEVKSSKVGNAILTVANYVSGGAIEERRIEAEQGMLNNRILKFNNKYDGKELSESAYKKAIAEQKFIESEQKRIDNRYDALVASNANKVRNLSQKFSIQKTPRLTTSERAAFTKNIANDAKIQRDIKKNQPLIKKKQSQINQKQKKLNSIPNNSVINFLKRVKLQNQIKTLRNDIARLKYEMPPRIVMGSFPIVPASAIPSGITNVKFLGTQRTGKGGKIITDIVFKTTKGTSGIAKGVAVTKKGKTISVVGGRLGKVAVKFPSGKKKLTGIKTFLGVEKSRSKVTKFTSDSLRKIAKFMQKKKKAGVVRAIKSNIEGVAQRGMGNIAVVKGKKFFRPNIRFPSGRIVKSMKKFDLDEFASVAAVLTKGNISKIVGKTITLKGRRAEFIGVIKSLSKTAGSRVVLSGTDKAQYSKAMQKLFTSVAAAVSKAERSGQFTTRTLVLAAAAKELSKGTAAIGTIRPRSGGSRTKLKKPTTRKTSVSITKVKPKTTSISKRVLVSTRTKVKTIQKQISSIKSKSKQLSKQKSKTRSKTKSRTLSRQLSSNRTKQRQLQKQLQRLQSKLKTKQVTISPTIVPSINLRSPKRFILPRLPKGFKQSKLRKSQQTYYVVEKVRGKFKKLYPKPLRMKDARDYAVYSIDHNLSKTAFFVPLGKSKNIVRPPKKIGGYYSKNKRKVRPFKIRFGKKRQLVNGYIEKRKYFQDTTGEKRQLKASKRKMVRRKLVKRTITKRTPVKRKPTQRRKVTGSQRAAMLKRLKKARAVRMRNLKKKR